VAASATANRYDETEAESGQLDGLTDNALYVTGMASPIEGESCPLSDTLLSGHEWM